MKILFVSPLPPPNGGISHWTVVVSEYAKKYGDDVRVINTAPKNRSVDGRTKMQRIWGGIESIFEVKKILKREINDSRPDVVHISASGSLAFARDFVVLKYLKKRGIQTSYHLHFGRIPYLKITDNWEWKLFLKNAAMACAVIAMNKFTYEALEGVVARDKLFNVPNPIDVERLPEPLDYDLHEKSVLYLGWFQKTKGSDELLKAWKGIKKEVPDWKLKIVGPINDEYRQKLQSECLCDDVEFLGEMPHHLAMENLKNAGLLVLPSHSEGFPNVILEAMALKVPVVATKVGSIPEMINEKGILVEPKDVDGLKKALRDAIQDDSFRSLSSNLLYDKVLLNYTLSSVYIMYRKIWRGFVNE